MRPYEKIFGPAATALAFLAAAARADAPKPDHSGVVIDHSPASTRQYVGSPGLAVLADGTYVAAHDFFGPGSTKDRTVVFGSTDKGQTWEKRAEVQGQWWSSLFVHQDALYLMGTSKEYGHAVIRKSTDGGKTWTTPKDKASGLLLDDGKYHCAPVPVVVHDGRIWRAMEDAMGPGGWGHHFRAFMMSAPADADLLKADSWTCSNRLGRDPDWLGGRFGGWLEGNAVVTPDGRVVNLLRVDYRAKGGEKAAVVEVSKDGTKATFDPKAGFLDFPGGAKKFTVRYDPRSKHYWSLTNYVPDKHQSDNPGRVRNTLALVASPDLKKWEVRCVVLYNPDVEKHGFQYVDWLFDGDDLIAAVRTAHDDGLGGAHNQHDANYLTFHRFQDFRRLTMKDSVSASADKPEMTPPRKDVKPFQYVEANVPFYPPGEKWGKTGEPIKKMQLPLDPDESMKHMVHPVGFELRLFASEAQLGGKPICMNWDEHGRLWVAVTVDYPNELQPEGRGRDRILVLEDTDGDGRADKVTVFADKLSIPTSLAFARGGVIVHQMPHTLFLKDTDGDGKADERQVLFSGWGTRDTHAGPSNLRHGLDNWLYGMVGYSGFEGAVGGERHKFSQGFYRFKPDGSKLEFLRNTNNNSWGVGFSEEGLLFGSTANGNPSVYLPVPNRYYEAVRGWSSGVLPSISGNEKMYPITDKVRQVDWHGHFTAAAGHALYTARSYPKEYWNRAAFVTEPTGHLVATFLLERSGADFRSRNAWNLLASDDEWAAPVMAEVGPDGQVWVLDWYNYIVQHNPTPPGFKTGKGNAYETELRDKKHGRIYRLVYKDAKPYQPLSLQDAAPEKLVETLKHENMFWRQHAQRLLVERGKRDVVPALLKLAADDSADEIGLNAGVTHALWTLHGLGALDGSDRKATAAAVAALGHKSVGVRRNAAAVLPREAGSVKALLDGGLLGDADAQVRLAALLALADLPVSSEAGVALARALTRPENVSDRWLADALTSAAAAHGLPFLQAVTANKAAPAPRALEIVAVVAEHFARGGPDKAAGPLVVALADADPKTAEAVVAGLAKGWPKDRPADLTDEAEKALTTLFTRASPGAKGQLVRLAAAWGSKGLEKHAEEIVTSLLAVVTDEKAADDPRAAAARRLVEFRPGDAQVVEKLLEAVTPRSSPQLTAGFLDALAASQAANVGPALVERLGGWSPSARAAALRVLLGRPEPTRALLDALDKGKVQLAELTLEQKQALAAYPDRQIAARAKKVLERGGGLPNADRQKVLDELLPLTKRTGDAAAGKAVFTKHCATCHTHTGEGNKVGPDLTGVAVHTREHLLTDILDPSRSVEGNFRVYTVLTKDGRVLNGLLASETKTAVELFDAEAKKHTLLRENIDQLEVSNKSLMPEGFEKQLSPDDLVNLLEFLTRRGKYLPLPLDKVATVVSTQGMFNSKDARAERLVFDDWKPKTFEGVPFVLVDPQGERVPNVVLLYGPQGKVPPQMPKSVRLPCNAPAQAIHLLSGVGGWAYPFGEKGSVSLVVRLHYEDGKAEDHELKNGEHFADYIRRVDVPGSQFAFKLRDQQVRYLAVRPKREATIKEIELVKGPDNTAPVVMAVTVEGR